MGPARLLRLARETAPPVGDDPADSELLRRYAAERDEAAFAELVRRNGALVLRTCRHVLGEAGAEDAFQATFLLLVRSPGRLTRPGSLAGWLHAAAVRIACRARRAEGRRREREIVATAPPVAPDDLTWREVREVLDTELAALPEKYRVPLVLCYLQELSYEEAARRAGCPVGALRGRLERGKERLRKRLARYGLPLAAPALIVGCPPPLSAALIETTLGAIRSAKDGTVPPALAALLPTTGRLRVVLVLAPTLAALVAIGVTLAANGSPTLDPPKVDRPKPASPVAEAVPQPTLDHLGDPLPPGAVARLGTRRLFGAVEPRWAAFSPDGRKIASQNWSGVTANDAATGRTLFERTYPRVVSGALGWRADGSGVAVCQLIDESFFVSAFTDPNEKLPTPPPPGLRRPGRVGPDGLEFLALSPDATQLAVIGAPDEKQFTIDLLPATVGRPVAGLKAVKTLGPFDGPCRELRFTSRGVLFLTGSWKEGDWTLSVVDPDKNAVARTVTIPPPAYCVWGFMYSLSADGRFAAVPYRPKTVKEGQSFTNQHDGTIHLWDLEAGKEVGSIPFPKVGYGTGHAFTPDGKKLITSGENPYVQIWDVGTGKELARSPMLDGKYGSREAAAIAFGPDGKRFATARRDGRLDIWDAATAEPVAARYETHRDKVEAVEVSPDGRLVATLAEDNAIRVWELATGKPVRVVPAPRVFATAYLGPKRRVAFTPDGRGLLFAAGADLSLVDPTAGQPLDLPGGLRGSKGTVGGFSADGKTLATVAGDAVTLWDWPAGSARLVVTVPLVPRKETEKDKEPKMVWVNSVSLSPDGRFLFTNSVQGPKITPYCYGLQNANDMWDTRTGKHLHRLEKPEFPPAHFSPDGRVLYLGGQSVSAWNPATGKILRRFVEPDRTGQRPPQFGWRVETMAVSPDGRLLATAEYDWSIDGVWVYETASGRLVKKFAGHREVKDLTFSPDGRRLVSVSGDQTGLVWDVTLPALVTGRVGNPTEKDLVGAWERLGGSDPVPGYLGIATLVAAPADAVALLKAKLRPAPVPTDADLDRVTARLGSDEAADREQASAELERFGPNAVAGAKVRLAGADSAEVRDRLTRFLTRYNGPTPSPYEVRCARGVAALEAIGTPEAKELLRELARAKTEDTLTREAAAAHRRAGNR